MVEKITDKIMNIISLYRFNYAAQYHVRQMAKLLKTTHVTLLPHLKSLEKDKILIPQRSGKNKSYSLNFDNVLVKNYILLSEILSSAQFLSKLYLVKKIYHGISILNLPGTIILFGSYSKGTFKDDSDIDILYLGETKSVKLENLLVIGKAYGKKISIKTSSIKAFEAGIRKKDALISEIVKNHAILQNPGQYVNILWRYYNEIKN